MNRRLYDELLLAIYTKDQKSVEKWLEKNPYDLNGATPDYQATPLCYAVRCGSLEIVELLVEKGANVNYAIPVAYTPLMEASKLNDSKLRILIFLLEKGADINQSAFNDKKTALFVAVLKQNIPAIQYLLEKGANTEIGMPTLILVLQEKTSILPFIKPFQMAIEQSLKCF
jgi:ankyrin repeat protein